MAATRPARPAKKATPQQKAAEEAPQPPPPAAAGKGRSLIVPAIVIAVALLGAAFLMKGGKSKEPTATGPSSTESSTVAAEKDGARVSLDPITMNLAGGDIVKVGIALQLSDTPESTAGKKALADPKNFGARALDELITVLGDYTRDDLSKPGGLAEAKSKLAKRVELAYHGDVIAVYLTQFVIA
jgi:flagellar FliL protein